MAEAKFQPSNEAINKILDKHSPRQVAIALIRATRRARSAEAAFKMIDKLTEATDAARGGDFGATKAALDKVLQTTRSLKESGET